MLSRFLLAIRSLPVVLVGIVVGLPMVSRAEDEPLSPQAVTKLIRDLDSDRFVVREQATQKLISAGAVAVSLLQNGASESLEANTRLVHILREITLSDDEDAQIAGHDALQKLTEGKLTSVARMASGTLAMIGDLRRKQAVNDLVRLGATQTPNPTIFANLAVNESQTLLEFGEKWQGELKDLRRLRWLNEQTTLQLIGPHVTDEWLPYLAEAPELTTLVIKRATLSDRGVAELKRLRRLTNLQILYVPVGDTTIESLGEMRQLASLKLYGTKITRAAAKQLQDQLIATKVDHRLGAFLGVGGIPAPFSEGFQVNLIHPRSAADKAGMQVGDVIVRIDGHPIPDFEELTNRISEKRSGDHAKVEVKRDGDPVKLDVTFGEWD